MWVGQNGGRALGFQGQGTNCALYIGEETDGRIWADR